MTNPTTQADKAPHLRTELTLDEARRLIGYDPLSGVLTYLVHRGHFAAGSVAGKDHRGGYRELCINGRMYKAHRLAWFITHGDWPAGEIDHMDGDRKNNAIANLRDVSRTENMHNRSLTSRVNKTGMTGVYWRPNRFSSSIGVNGRIVHVGTFKTAEEAQSAYIKAKSELHSGFVGRK